MDISNHKHVKNLIWYDMPLLDLYSDGNDLYHRFWVDCVDDFIHFFLVYKVPDASRSEYATTDILRLILSARKLPFVQP